MDSFGPYFRLETQVAVVRRLLLLLLRLIVAKLPVSSTDYETITRCMQELNHQSDAHKP